MLQRERKKRNEAAEAYPERGAGRSRPSAERAEVELIDGYLPEQISDAELDSLIAERRRSRPARPR